MDATFVPWLWADVNMAGERQLFPLAALNERWACRAVPDSFTPPCRALGGC